MGPRVASKLPSHSPRAEGEARGLRDGISNASQGPIWYLYYLIVLIVYFIKNICITCFVIIWHQNMALKILQVLQIRLNFTTSPKFSSK